MLTQRSLMDGFAFTDDLFEQDDQTLKKRHDRIAAFRAEAATWTARIDSRDRLEGGAEAIERILDNATELPSHELRRLEAMCNRLYYLRRHVECLQAVLALLRWSVKRKELVEVDDEQLADLAMRSSLRCEKIEAIRDGVNVADASQKLVRRFLCRGLLGLRLDAQWPSFAGLCLSSAACYERANKSDSACTLQP